MSGAQSDLVPVEPGAKYEVAIRETGREIIGGGVNNPLEGLLTYPKHRWTKLTRRPIGFARAKALADAQDTHAVVCYWQAADKVHDNRKAARVPVGWWHTDAVTCFDTRRQGER